MRTRTKEVAEILGISYEALRNRMARGQITRPAERKLSGDLVWTGPEIRRAQREMKTVKKF